MDAEELRDCCLSLLGTGEEFPFGPETSAFKVAGKIFALSRLAEDPLRISLKCDPPLAEELRKAHRAVTPGYHLNKRHWNTVIIDGSLPDEMIVNMVEDSYDLVVSTLPQARRRALGWTGELVSISDERLTTAWDQALRLAWESFCARTTPVGAVVVSSDGVIVATGRGRRYEAGGPSGQLAGSHIAHAEINALAQLPSDRHYEDHLLLTTLEPCAMCHGAVVQATLGALMFAGPDPYGGTATLRVDSPQARRRALTIVGPLADARGALATLLHLVWLMQKGGADHIVSLHDKALPDFTAYALGIAPELAAAAAAGDYVSACRIAAAAPWPVR